MFRTLRHRRTLVDLFERNIARTDDRGPDWRTAVEGAVLAQDMGWVLEAQAEPRPSVSGRARSASAY